MPKKIQTPIFCDEGIETPSWRGKESGDGYTIGLSVNIESHRM